MASVFLHQSTNFVGVFADIPNLPDLDMSRPDDWAYVIEPMMFAFTWVSPDGRMFWRLADHPVASSLVFPTP